MAQFAIIFKKVGRFIEWLSYQLGWIGGALTVVMMLAVLREVIGRYLFHAPTDWSVELTCYLVVGSGYLAGAYTELKERHVRIEFLHSRLRGRLGCFVEITTSLMGIVWCVVLVWQGFLMTWDSYITDARSETIMEWPLFPSQAMIPLGGGLLCLVLLIKVVRNVSQIVKEKT